MLSHTPACHVSVCHVPRAQRDLVSRGFGDDEALAAPLNPHYDPEEHRWARDGCGHRGN